MRIEPRPLLVLMTGIAIAVLAVGDALMLLSGTADDPVLTKVAEYFWADQEANIWSWYSSFLLGCIGIGLLVLAVLEQGRPARRSLVVLGVAAVVMSADETASLHEALGYLGDVVGGLTSHWLLLGVPLVVAAGLFAVRLARAVDPVLRRRLIIAGIIYVAGAVVLEFFGGMLSGPLGLPRTDPRYVLEVTIEEGLEIAGTLLAVRAVLLQVLAATRTREATTPGPGARIRP